MLAGSVGVCFLHPLSVLLAVRGLRRAVFWTILNSMIYFDTAATALQRPTQVGQSVLHALAHMGNPGRGIYDASMDAARAVSRARHAVAAFVGGAQANSVAFTSGVTESFHLLIRQLIGPDDAVITTVLEHNSVLRPLYQTGCELAFLDCDEQGTLLLDQLPSLLRSNTRFMVCTHGSNVLGSCTDLARISDFCKAHGLLLLVDAAQTMGLLPLQVEWADFICFTGHKGLMGPPGTGGVVAPNLAALADRLPPSPFKTGGTGSDSFAPAQPLRMPDTFEAGTPNVPGLCGLSAGCAFVQSVGQQVALQHDRDLAGRFCDGVRDIPGLTLYGPQPSAQRLGVVALNLRGADSEEVSLRLWERYQIATRPGSHCAPLLHRRFATEQIGMVRFSFGWFNTNEEVDAATRALAELAREMR